MNWKKTAGLATGRALALSLMLWGVQQSAQADVILLGNQNTLYTINPTNAAVLTTVGLSRGGLLNFALAPGGVLYGLFLGDGGNALGTIDRSSGAVTMLGMITGGAGLIGQISFDSAGNLLGFASSGDIVYLNPGTAAVGASFGCALAFPPSFTVGANAFATVGYLDSSANGAAFKGVAGTGFSCSGSGAIGTTAVSSQLIAITTALSGSSYYGARQQIGSGVQIPYTLVSFNYSGPNVAIPNLTTIGALPSSNPVGIAFDAGGAFAPEPGSISLLAFGVGGLALYRWKRRPANGNG